MDTRNIVPSNKRNITDKMKDLLGLIKDSRTWVSKAEEIVASNVMIPKALIPSEPLTTSK